MYPLTAATVIETKELWDELHASVAALPVRFVLELSDIADESAFLEKLARIGPDILFLDVSKNRSGIEKTIKSVRAMPTSPSVIALNTTDDSAAILESLRAGAAEYLFPPFETLLHASLERISGERHKTTQSFRRGGKVLGFLSAKGGCGATSLACHAGAALPRLVQDTKVLIADLDFDSGIIGFLLKGKSPYTVLDAALNTQRLDANYWGALVSNGIPGVEFITSPPPPLKQPPTGDSLRFVLNFSRAHYDWVVVDLGRNLSMTAMNTLDQIDELFLVSTLEVPALHSAKLLVSKLLEAGYLSRKIHILLNQTPDRFDVTVKELESMIGAPVYAVIPNHRNTLNESFNEGKLVDEGSDLGRHYAKLAMKIAGVEPPKKKRFSLFG